MAQSAVLGQADSLWPLLVYFGMAVATIAGMMVASHVLGQRHHDRTTHRPYESGMEPTGSARLRYPADFYLVGLFFVIFDLETMFIITWAIAIRQTGWAGFAEIGIFLAVLLICLGYLWRGNALDWVTKLRPINRASMEGRKR